MPRVRTLREVSICIDNSKLISTLINVYAFAYRNANKPNGHNDHDTKI